MAKKILRIVVASPSDVRAEREIVTEVVEELNRNLAAVVDLRLEVSRWETDAFPGFHAEGPQGWIDPRLRIQDCDLLIGIFWKRIGTKTPGGKSGTEHEFQTAYEEWKATGRPQIMVYFCQRPYMPLSKAETDQQGRVLEFKDAFPEQGLWWSYKGKLEFEKTLRSHLSQFILHRATLESSEAKAGSISPEPVVDVQRVRAGSRPAGTLARRPLHFIWMIDCSSSMAGTKMETVNYAMRETLRVLREAASDNPHLQMLFGVVSFSTGARWHVPTPTPVEDFHWHDLHAGGVTDAGAALVMVAEQLAVPPMSDRALPPVLVLLLDGQPTDDFPAGLKRLNEQVWGRKSVRLGVAVGSDADTQALQLFMGTDDRTLFGMHTPEELLQYINWVTTSVAQPASNVRIPAPVDLGQYQGDPW